MVGWLIGCWLAGCCCCCCCCCCCSFPTVGLCPCHLFHELQSPDKCLKLRSRVTATGIFTYWIFICFYDTASLSLSLFTHTLTSTHSCMHTHSHSHTNAYSHSLTLIHSLTTYAHSHNTHIHIHTQTYIHSGLLFTVNFLTLRWGLCGLLSSLPITVECVSLRVWMGPLAAVSSHCSVMQSPLTFAGRSLGLSLASLFTFSRQEGSVR